MLISPHFSANSAYSACKKKTQHKKNSSVHFFLTRPPLLAGQLLLRAVIEREEGEGGRLCEAKGRGEALKALTFFSVFKSVCLSSLSLILELCIFTMFYVSILP